MTVTNRTIRTLSALAGAALFWIVAVPQLAEAQKAVPRGGGDQIVKAPSSGGATKAAPSGGDQTGGGQTSSGGGGQTASDSPKTAPAQRRPPSDGASRRGGRTVAPRDRSGAAGNTPDVTATGNGGSAVPPYSRPRGDNPQTGQAVERRGRPPVTGDGGTVWVPGGYYGGYYPWGYGGMGLGGYYGGYYDPWYYGDPQGYSPYAGDYDGELRLKVKPRDAEVFVDGYYAGLVDEFDGVFQRLHVEPGPHRIEIRAEGYEPLGFEVRIQPDRTITYTGELKPLSP